MVEWSLYDKKTGKLLSPLKYSNGKTQQNVVEEILDALKTEDIVLLHASVGTGKSVIALHIVKHFGKGNIVVPTKILEKQYHEDYTNRFCIKDLDIQYFMGKSNYQCKYFKGQSYCGSKLCPCSTALHKDQKRIDVAKECPHYSPVVSIHAADRVREILEDEHGVRYDIKTYESFRGKQAHIVSPDPCNYFRTFSVYTDKSPHATIFNLAKWEIETWLGRKAVTPVEIIDEGDMFLDSLSYKVTFSSNVIENLKKDGLVPIENIAAFEYKFNETINIVKTYDNVLGYNDYVIDLLNSFLDLMAGVSTSGTVCQMVERVKLILQHQYQSWCKVFKKKITVYIPRPDLTLKALMKRCGKLVLMSGTFQSRDVLNDIFGIDPPVIEGETRFPGIVKLRVAGKEMEVTSTKWDYGGFRDDYWKLLNIILSKAKRPTLVQVHAYKYVPEDVVVNKQDKNIWWSTVTDRGIDLRDDKCRSIVILKYPFPDLSDPVLKTMQRVLKGKFWKYYNDIARRELIQQIGRGVRSKNDWVEVWSPDRRVIREIPKVWKGKIEVGRVKIDENNKYKTL